MLELYSLRALLPLLEVFLPRQRKKKREREREMIVDIQRNSAICISTLVVLSLSFISYLASCSRSRVTFAKFQTFRMLLHLQDRFYYNFIAFNRLLQCWLMQELGVTDTVAVVTFGRRKLHFLANLHKRLINVMF